MAYEIDRFFEDLDFPLHNHDSFDLEALRKKPYNGLPQEGYECRIKPRKS